MRSTTITALLSAAALLPSALAHYNFESLIHNGQSTEAYQYVRKTKNSNSPVTDVTSDDIICNVGGIDDDVMSATETYTVAAGDEVGFKVNANLGHPGPLAVYMSKAPGTAKEYKGDGDWFKVYELTTANLTSDPITWASFINGGIQNFTFTLPSEIPAGQYLMRGEHIGLHGAGEVNGAQFYIGCAQLEVTGSGAGSPSPTVKFPGAYDGTEPGILVQMYWPPLRNYTAPGPATWPNACEDHTANLDGQTSDGDCTPLDSSSSGDGSGNDNTVSSSSAAGTPTTVISSSTSTPTSKGDTTTPVSSTVQSAVTDITSASASSVVVTSINPTASPATSSGSTPNPSSSPCSKRRRRRSVLKH